jgi:DNA-binding transcriptional ArsR family regulator
MVSVVATPWCEFLTGMQTFQFEEAASTLDVDAGWFDEVRTKASNDLTVALSRLGPVGWGTLLAKALVERWPHDVTSSMERVESMPPEELWLLFAGRHVVPFADRVGAETFHRAAGGDAQARERLATAAYEMFGDKEGETRLWLIPPKELHPLVCLALRAWYRDVFASQEQEVTAVLERDAEAKRRLMRTASDEKVIELATNGVVYVAEAWVRRVILTPHVAMRPWNVTSAHGDTYVMAYPVADESLGVDRAAPPTHLVRLHKALSDDKRLRILHLLADSDLNLQQLTDALGLAKSTAHHHTVILRAAGLIRTSTEMENRYSLRRESLAEAGTALIDYLEGGGPA